MGREIRRVPADWEHPRYTEEDAPHPNRVGDFIGLFDQDFEARADEWERDFELWRKGEHPTQRRLPEDTKGKRFWDWDGDPPSPDSYRARRWTEAEATHFQVYETVSEGTPVTPHFGTREELVDYLVANGDFWDQQRRREGGRWGDTRPSGGWDRKAAESFVGSGWAPSLMVVQSATETKVYEARDGMPPKPEVKT